jgi:iron(III) transport system ATP-binding protein
MTHRLVLTNVTRLFGARAAVRDVSITLDAGEVLCLLGPSGCGKSTTLRLAAGLERADGGTIEIDGQLVDGKSVFVPPEKRRVGLMFQDFALFPHLSVEDNVAFGLRGQSGAERAAHARQQLERVGMSHLAGAYPHMLSGGEQQRVALARALAPKPRIMLMDEPFSGLDERLRDSVRDETISTLKASGTATLVVTHDPEEAMRIADRIALMRDGRIVQIGPPAEIYDHPADAEAAHFFSDLNIVHATVMGGFASTAFGEIAAAGFADGTRVEVMFRPQFVGFAAPEAAPIQAEVVASRLLGDDSLVEVTFERPESSENGEPLVFRGRVPGRFLPAQGAILGVTANSAQAFVFPCQGGRKI